MKICCTEIVWDTDGEDVGLPTEATIKVPDGTDINDDHGQIADALSDEYGWCVRSVKVER